MISPIEMNGVLSRTQDIASLRHNEENRTDIENSNVHLRMELKADENVNTVKSADQSSNTDTKHDAKEKGKNEFFDIRRKDKKSKEPDEVVIKKTPSSGFDLKI